jgi:hypothetical protein
VGEQWEEVTVYKKTFGGRKGGKAQKSMLKEPRRNRKGLGLFFFILFIMQLCLCLSVSLSDCLFVIIE